jgi:hypothetical protein
VRDWNLAPGLEYYDQMISGRRKKIRHGQMLYAAATAGDRGRKTKAWYFYFY